MDYTGTHSTLRERLAASPAVGAPERGRRSPTLDDPFAGEDERWAEEDWLTPAQAEDGSGDGFFYGLMVALALSAVAWVAFAFAGVLAYKLIA